MVSEVQGGAGVERRVNQIKQQLSAHNYKLTPQREATVQVLLENEEDHLSAEDVYLLVKNKAPEIGLATVYRTLELLSDLQIIYKLNFGDGVTRYEFRAEGAEHHHHHLICLHCGRVDEIIEDLLGPIEERVEKEHDFQIIDHRLTFHGICHRCQGQVSDPRRWVNCHQP
jgi:Fur family transcriptional regulator, ferric uptake regulator